MLLRRLGYTALAAAAALVSSVSAAQSTFVSTDNNIAFGFSVPDNDNEDFFFTIRMKKKYSWGGIGIGSDDMPGALYFIIYQNERGDNVTFSPRLATKNMEPKYFPDLKYEVLEGTGVFDDHIYFSARCTEHCRSWPSGGTSRGFIDVDSPNEDAIYAVGPRQGYGEDSPSANLKYHREYGNFVINMKRAQGTKEPPTLSDKSEAEGVEYGKRKTAKINWRTTIHMLCMLLSVAGTIPMGVALVRVPAWRKWHAFVQTASLNLIMIGFIMGVVTSGLFQKSYKINSYHQIIGLLAVIFILAQWGLGFAHHMKWKKTQMPNIYGMVHVWLGRTVVTMAILNAFFGFIFAQNQRFAVLLAIVIVVSALSYIALFYARRYLHKKRERQNVRPLANNYQPGAPSSHQPEPWRDHQQPGQTPFSPAPSNAVPSAYQSPPPQYAQPSGDINMQTLSPWRSASTKKSQDPVELDGTSQRPAELV